MDNKRCIFIIDDEPDMLDTYARVITRMGHKCLTFEDSFVALEEICKIQPDLVITDLKMPGCDGFEVLAKVKDCVSDAMVVVITGYASVDSAVRAMQEGAYDYLPKPFSLDQLQLTINKALKQMALKEENMLLRTQLQEVVKTENIIGANGGLQHIFATIGKMAKSDASTLIIGESGTGKEMIARAIHANSKRATGPFIPVDCASLPENLLESELFGYEKGAFTGANKTKPGLLELADGGTLFLDEIGEMKPLLQAKLLRTLEEYSFRRVGGNHQHKVDMRIVAATNRDLAIAVQNKEFREDLLYRINVITLKLPSLRERQQDIPLLVNHFCQKYAKKINDEITGFSREAMQKMVNYTWPGNVRELRNVVERAVSLCSTKIVEVRDLPPEVTQATGGILDERGFPFSLSFHEAKDAWVSRFEIKYLKDLLGRHNGNITEAAQAAGIDRKTIHRLINKHRL